MAYMRRPATDIFYVHDANVDAYKSQGWTEAEDIDLDAFAANDIYSGHQGVPTAPALTGYHPGYQDMPHLSNLESPPSESQAVERKTHLIVSPADEKGPYDDLGLRDHVGRDNSGRPATKAELRKNERAAAEIAEQEAEDLATASRPAQTVVVQDAPRRSR